MKKSKLTKLIAVVLVLAMLSASFGAVTAGASSAYPILSSGNPIGILFADIVDTLLRILTDFLAGLFGNGPGFVDPDDQATKDRIAANYFDGIGPAFQKEAQSNAKWRLGYANASLIPEDYDNGTYYIGGYISLENGFTNVVEGIAEIPGIGKDDMKVRCMAIDDNTGNGTILFAVIDCIGITNADIKDIRALLADYAAMHNIQAINVSSTHTHSCIDTEGLWTKNIAKLVSNGVISGTQKKTDGKLQQGTNPAYMAWLKERVADALIAAHRDIKAGSLTYTTKDLGQGYFQNKNRPSSGEIVGVDTEGNLIVDSTSDGFKSEIAMTNIERFIFTPEDKTATPTMIINLAAHPDVAGLPTESNSGREISGDYIFYCEKILNEAGYNFIFFQGAIAGIYMSRTVTGDNVDTKQRVEESQRYGYELARIALSLNKTEEEVFAEAWNKNSNIYNELVDHATQIPVFDENGKAVEQVTTPGNNYTVLIDAQGKTVEVVDKTINVLDGDKVLYELNYTANESIIYEELAQSYAVSNGGSILAVVVTGSGKKVVCPNEHMIALYSEETSELIMQLPVGSSRVVTDKTEAAAYTKENGFRPEVYDFNNNYAPVVDSHGLDVVADYNTNKLETSFERVYSPYDNVYYFEDIDAEVVLDPNYQENAAELQTAISAFMAKSETPTIKFTDSGKAALFFSDGTQYSVDGVPKEFDCTIKGIFPKSSKSVIKDVHTSYNDIIDAKDMNVKVSGNNTKLTITDANGATVLSRSYTPMDFIYKFEELGTYVVFNFANMKNAAAINAAVQAFVAQRQNPVIKFTENGKIALYFADGTPYKVDNVPQEFDYVIKTIITTDDPTAVSKLPAKNVDVVNVEKQKYEFNKTTYTFKIEKEYELMLSDSSLVCYSDEYKAHIVYDLYNPNNSMSISKILDIYRSKLKKVSYEITDAGKMVLYNDEGKQFAINDVPQEFEYSIRAIVTTEGVDSVSNLPLNGCELVYEDSTIIVPQIEGALTACQINPLYSVWFENWNKKSNGADAVPAAQPVDPFLNIYITQVEIPITNTLITAIGKLNMANYVVKAYPDGSYTTVTEIGYMEWGKQFKTVLLPGEICQDLVALDGASLLKENSITGSAFSEHVKNDKGYTTAAAIFGKDVKCFGVMNDAIGYVVPDNDYTMGDPANHYHELISLGQYIGSSLIDGLAELKAEIDANTNP